MIIKNNSYSAKSGTTDTLKHPRLYTDYYKYLNRKSDGYESFCFFIEPVSSSKDTIQNLWISTDGKGYKTLLVNISINSAGTANNPIIEYSENYEDYFITDSGCVPHFETNCVLTGVWGCTSVGQLYGAEGATDDDPNLGGEGLPCGWSFEESCSMNWDYCGNGDAGSGGAPAGGGPSGGGGEGNANTYNPPRLSISDVFSPFYTLPYPSLTLLQKFIKNELNNDQQEWWQDPENVDERGDIEDFFEENGLNEDTKAFAKEYFEIVEELPDAKFKRFEELIELTEAEPFALLEDCAEQNGLDTDSYLDLYNYNLPISCRMRLNNLGEDYKHQPLDDGNVACANIDYYGVEITSTPDFNDDGQPDTQNEIFEAFREKFTDLASGEKDNFQFSCDIPNNPNNTGDLSWDFVPFSDPYDSNLFLSNNPISSILMIQGGVDISGVVGEFLTVDDGAIIVSGFTNNNWTISTIKTGYTDTQPFSGNRRWGIHINQDGNLEIYTKAVDVARVSNFALMLNDIECNELTYYDIADATWQNMQQEIKDWIEGQENYEINGGQAEIISPETIRVDKEKIEELLKSSETIQDIGCN